MDPRLAELQDFMAQGPPPALELPSIEKRLATLLNLIAEEIRPCRACGVQLSFVRHRTGKLAPYTLDGVNHFINCPKGGQFRKRKEEGKN
jgi:hypothetical protein